ncbi:MAG: hypothetical protein F4018_15125 [Acidobacteria bacterium]|nr:hypothetical protein [Acidobacteriota bacterium]MYH31601.1 hypothetical protein [Acidobacteriota bacterium]MYK89554.1 hypothetical protein [Acidobacteriota bacterium]
MATVISDAGPLIALARVDSLFVPKALFSRIHIPEAVRDECARKPGEDTRRIEQAIGDGWIRVVSVKPGPAERRFSLSLGRGETEAIQLALETTQSLLIVDDRLARRQALQCGLAYVGTVRMLLEAEERQVIRDAEATVHRITASGYRISPRILEQLKAS